MAKSSFDLRAWALIGAQQRLRDLDQERAAILAAFPQLRAGAGGRRGRPRGSTSVKQASGVAGGRKRKRRRLSKEARRRISEAQKARWAKQKGNVKKKSAKSA
jgi:hypothetical protein